jgi:hypothetical protein
VLSAALAMSSCSALAQTPDQKIDQRSLRGETFERVTSLLPENASYVIQNVSASFGIEADHDVSDSESDGWIVVALCLDDPRESKAHTVEVAIIPEEAASAEVRATAKTNGYADILDCSDVFVGADAEG